MKGKILTKLLAVLAAAFLVFNISLSHAEVPDTYSDVYIDIPTNTLMVKSPDKISPEQFVIKGVNWNPAAKFFGLTLNDTKGLESFLQYMFTTYYPADLPLIAGTGANTVRVYADFGLSLTEYKNILDEAYNQGLMVIMTVAVNKEDLDSAKYLQVVNAYKNHPAILMWAIGNEFNINKLYDLNISVEVARTAVNNAAKAIKAADMHHPVAVILGDQFVSSQIGGCSAWKVEDIVRYCPDVDIWGLNVYRDAELNDASKENIFTEWARISKKPFFFSEFGLASGRQVEYSMNNGQCVKKIKEIGTDVETDKALLSVIDSHLSINNANDYCLGGVLHQLAEPITDSASLYSGFYAQDYATTAVLGGGFIVKASVPVAPANLTATSVSGSQINLSWEDTPDEIAFKIERKIGTGGTWEQIATGITATTYQDTGLVESTTYYYRVRAYNFSGNGPYSNEAYATTSAPDTTGPTGSVVINGGAQYTDISAVTLTLAASDAGSGMGSGALMKFSNDNANWSSAESYATSKTWTLASGTGVKTVYVKFRDAAGNWSSVNITDTIEVLYTRNAQYISMPVPPPSNMSPGQTASVTIRMKNTGYETWTAANNYKLGSQNPQDNTNWGIMRVLLGASDAITTNQTKDFTFNITAPSNPGTYNFQWKMLKESVAWFGGLTSNVSISVQSASMPAAPSDLTATIESATSIRLNWTDNSSNETGFKIEWKPAGGSYAEISTGPGVVTYLKTGLTTGTTYYFRVKACNGSLCSAYSNEVSTAPNNPPAVPAGLTAAAISVSQINLSWSAASGASSYNLYRSATQAGAYAKINTSAITATTYNNTGLTANTEYWYKVSSVNTAGESAQSGAVSKKTLPAALTNFRVTGQTESSISLAWDSVGGLLGYDVYRSSTQSGTYTKLNSQPMTTASYTNTGLTGATTYWYKAKAVNTSGESAFSTAVSGTTTLAAPNAPTNLTATAATTSQINLTWVDNSGNETGFKIERKTGPSGTWSQISTVGAGITTFSSTGLTAGTQYYYRIRAYNAAGDSGYSNERYGITYPSAPSSLTVTASTTAVSITLNWVNTGGDSYRSFYVQRKTGSGGAWSGIAYIPDSSRATYTDDYALAIGTTYYYRVYASNPSGNSAYSNERYATTLNVPSIPTLSTPTSPSASQISLSWSNVSYEQGYKIERSPNGSSSWVQVGATNANVTTYTDSGLSAGTTYYYRVRAYNAAGNSGYSSIKSRITRPAAVHIWGYGSQDPYSVPLYWNDVAGETGYKIQRSLDGSNWSSVTTVGAGVVSYTNTGCNPNTRYYYRIIAYNVSGDALASNTASYLTYPGKANSVGASVGPGAKTLTVTWTNNSYGCSSISIQRRRRTTDWVTIASGLSSSTTSYRDTTASECILAYYRYRVITRNASGDTYSNDSNEATPNCW